MALRLSLVVHPVRAKLAMGNGPQFSADGRADPAAWAGVRRFPGAVGPRRWAPCRSQDRLRLPEEVADRFEPVLRFFFFRFTREEVRTVTVCWQSAGPLA